MDSRPEDIPVKPETAFACQPGWRRETPEPAPEGGQMQRKVLAELRRAPGTCEDVAGRLGASLLTVRPRCSELRAQGRIVDSGGRGASASGRKVIIWRVLER